MLNVYQVNLLEKNQIQVTLNHKKLKEDELERLRILRFVNDYSKLYIL